MVLIGVGVVLCLKSRLGEHDFIKKDDLFVVSDGLFDTLSCGFSLLFKLLLTFFREDLGLLD